MLNKYQKEKKRRKINESKLDIALIREESNKHNHEHERGQSYNEHHDFLAQVWREAGFHLSYFV